MRFSALVPLCILLVSCATLTLDKVAPLRKGMTREEVSSIVKVQPKLTYDRSDSITVEVYEMANSSLYYISYRKGMLLFWGYPHEYGREKDELLN